MPTPRISDSHLRKVIAWVEEAHAKGHPLPGTSMRKGEINAAGVVGRALGYPDGGHVIKWLREAEKRGMSIGGMSDYLPDSIEIPPSEFNPPSVEAIKEKPQPPEAGWLKGPRFELVSRPDNTFCFGAFGDLHAGSKYTRWDVREDLVRRSEARGAQAIYDTGNWIEGVASFNRYDLVASGMSAQCKLLAEKHPRTKLPIFAVTGDDHEGWFAQREGVDIGRYCEITMQDAGHDWHDLGYMEAHILLRNANSGKTAIMAVVHPGGGSAYALSYRPQKIIEALEGGEKPAVALFGHYHKLEAANIRNVWIVQTGCQQDQTPFMRKKSIEAHVGGAIITLEQDPETGAIIGMAPELIRAFNKGYNDVSRRWSHHGDVEQPRRER